MPLPAASRFHIVFHMQPGFKPFEDDGRFDPSCTIITYSGGSSWCASDENPSCTALPSSVPLEGWQWTPTGLLRWGGPASSETRMLFEGNGVLQRVRVAAGAAPLSGFSVELTGAFQRVTGMSWVTKPLGSTTGYVARITAVGAAMAPSLLTCKADTQTVCGVWVVSRSSVSFNTSCDGTTAALEFSTVEAGGFLEFDLALVVGANTTEALALASTVSDAAGFTAAWDGFADGWATRWTDAFTPKPSGGGAGHYSGSLPVLTLDASPAGAAISRLYYMGALSILQAERTNLPLVAPRVYVTGTGNELCGIAVGGTEQWAWDQSE